MDEAHMLGRGKHLDIHGYESVDIIMKRHLKRLCEIAEKYGYESMIWSDMFFRPWNKGAYYSPKTELPREYTEALPKSVIPVYWDYYQTSEERYSDMMQNFARAVRGEKNPYTPDYELGLFKLLMKSCGKEV